MTEKDLEDQKAHAEATSDLIVENEKLKQQLDLSLNALSDIYLNYIRDKCAWSVASDALDKIAEMEKR